MGLKDEATLFAEEFQPDFKYTRTQNAKSLKDFKLQTATTDFDAVLFRDVKLKQLPKFLWQNLGWTGVHRFDNAVTRSFGGLAHTTNARGLRWFWFSIAVFSIPSVLAFGMKEKRRADLIVKLKYGDAWETMDNYEKTYFWRKIVRDLNKPHFV